MSSGVQHARSTAAPHDNKAIAEHAADEAWKLHSLRAVSKQPIYRLGPQQKFKRMPIKKAARTAVIHTATRSSRVVHSPLRTCVAYENDPKG